MCVCVCVCVCVCRYYLRSLKFTIKHLKFSYMFRSPYAVQCESHAAQHTTHNHNEAHSKQRMTHTQKHDMLPQHQVNITKYVMH